MSIELATERTATLQRGHQPTALSSETQSDRPPACSPGPQPRPLPSFLNDHSKNKTTLLKLLDKKLKKI